MDMKEVYKILSYHHLNQDDEQEIAIKIWEKREQYNDSFALSTWISAVVKNYVISKSRSKQYKQDNTTSVISSYERETEGGTIINSIEEKMTSNELSPIDEMIASEETEAVLERINELQLNYKDALLLYIDGYDVDRALLYRAKYAFAEGRKRKSYVLTNLLDGKEYKINTLDEASKICGLSVEGIRVALKKDRTFSKKSWKIAAF